MEMKKFLDMVLPKTTMSEAEMLSVIEEEANNDLFAYAEREARKHGDKIVGVVFPEDLI